MTTRGRRFARRLLEVFDYRTFAVAGAFVTLLLVGYIVFSAFQAAHDATEAANRRGAAATRRIDRLNTTIGQLQAEIAAGRDERGQLAAAVAALTTQIRQLGGSPVLSLSPSAVTRYATPSSTVVSPAASPRTSTTPRPHPTATSTPSPTATPTPGLVCRTLPVLC